MRKNHLRQFVDNYCHHTHTGSHRTKKYRHYVLHKVIRDLFHIGKVPVKWHAITLQDIHKLVHYWQKERISPSTIMKYLKEMRMFFTNIGHTIIGIDNVSLGVTLHKKTSKTPKLSNNIETQIVNPIAKCLYGLQVNFGLTLSEAMRICPDIHLQENAIWITRDIASNSHDRLIPIRMENQLTIIKHFLNACLSGQSLISMYGYAPVRYAYSTAIKSLGASASKRYRSLYAKMIYKELIQSLPSYQAKQIIMREMGIHSRRTLWGYLNE